MVLHNSKSLADREVLFDEMIVLSREFLSTITQNAKSGDHVSPLLLHWAYQAASTYALLYRETGQEKHLKSWEVLEETLRVLNKRWMVAGMNRERDSDYKTKTIRRSIHSALGGKECYGNILKTGAELMVI
jgi:hypothetical protein